jgi:hypothetical protein
MPPETQQRYILYSSAFLALAPLSFAAGSFFTGFWLFLIALALATAARFRSPRYPRFEVELAMARYVFRLELEPEMFDDWIAEDGLCEGTDVFLEVTVTPLLLGPGWTPMARSERPPSY